jgi:hypothetical protein
LLIAEVQFVKIVQFGQNREIEVLRLPD